MDKIMEGLDFVFVFLDNILISSVDEEEQHHHLQEVFSRLHNAGLKINAGKSEFYKENLDFLCFNISKAGLRPNHKHTEAVRTNPAPPNKEDIARFTSLVNLFRFCIPKATQLMQPLTDLMRKSAVFCWGEYQDRAFQDTKQALVNATTLQHPSATAEVQLITDTSATRIGTALVQKEKHDKGWSPVAFYSKTLSPAERNYSTFHRKLLAAVRGVKKFPHFVEGCPFTLKSDHKPLIPSLLREKQADSPL